MTGVALLAGTAAVAGLMLVASGARPRPRPPRLRRLAPLPVPSPERVLVVAASALAVLFVTRWPVAAAGAGAAVWVLTSPSRRRPEEGDKAEALTGWVEMLRDAMAVPYGLEGVLVATAAGAPAAVRPHVTRLARRLPYEPLDRALKGLADDLDHPVGDLVVTALQLAARTGGRQIRAVLDDLATVAREEARMHQRIEVARARPRSDMRIVAVIMTVAVGLFVLLARDYLEPYGTPLGQLVLAFVGASWAAGIGLMARWGRIRPLERFLVREGQP